MASPELTRVKTQQNYFEFCKQFLISSDNEYTKLKGESGTFEIVSAISTVLFGATAFAAQMPAIAKASDVTQKIGSKIDGLIQEHKSLVHQHAINSPDSTSFRDNYRRAMLRAAIEIWHSYQKQLQLVYRKVDYQLVPSMTKAQKRRLREDSNRYPILNAPQAIQKLAEFAAVCCVKYLIANITIKHTHKSVLDPSFMHEILTLCKQFIDRLQIQWPSNQQGEGLTLADFFLIPTVAFPPTNDQLEDGKVILKFKDVDMEQFCPEAPKLRRPFDFEWEFYQQYGQLFRPKTVDGVEDANYFKWTDNSRDVDVIMEGLRNDPDFDKDDVILNKFEEILQTLKQHHKEAEDHWAELKQSLEKLNATSNKKARPWFNVLDPVASFSGRQTFLDEIHSFFISPPKGRIDARVKIITGQGGVGKTQMARKYIQNRKEFYKYIIWINAETRMSMEDDFKTLAHSWDILLVHSDGTIKAIGSVVQEIYGQIMDKQTLIVFDNAEKWHEDPKDCGAISQFLPTAQSPEQPNLFSILVTSKNSMDWGPIRNNLKPLETFNPDEAIHLVMTELKLNNTEENKSDAKTLGSLLNFLPLTLQQAVAYIKEVNTNNAILDDPPFTIQNYIDNFHDPNVAPRLLKFPPEDTLTTICKTVNLTLSKMVKLKNGAVELEMAQIMALEMAQILALVLPNNIPVSFIEALSLKLNLSSSQQDSREAMILLKKYAMISIDVIDKVSFINIHQQIQHIFLEGLEVGGKMVRILNSLIEPCKTFVESTLESNSIYPIVLNHLLKLTEHATIAWESNVLNFRSYLALKVRDAGERNEEALEILWNVEAHQILIGADILDTQGSIAYVLRCHRQYENAFAQYEKVYEGHKGSGNLKALTALSDMGAVRRRQKKYNEALDIYSKIYEEQTKAGLAENDSCLLKTRKNMAAMLSKLGRYPEARKVYAEIFELVVHENENEGQDIQSGLLDIYKMDEESENRTQWLTDFMKK